MEQIGDAFAHGHPLGLALAVACDPFADFEFRRAVDDGFDPEDESGFVDHFDPVLFHTMFDARSSHAAANETGQIRNNLSFKVAAQLPSHVGRSKTGWFFWNLLCLFKFWGIPNDG
ncbi:MAG TPA: hypothetical protein VGK48_20065 [Terriglobia bacterium]